MSDFEERLRAADPAAGTSYQHPNIDAMISRIELGAPLARRHVLRSFQLRMAGAATLAAVLTVGGIAAIQGAGPALQILALSAAKAAPSSTKGTHAPAAGGFAATQVPASNMMRIFVEFNFTAGPDLSTTAGSGASYQLQLASSPSDEAARVATIFGVNGTPNDQNGDGSDWNVTDTAGDTLDYQNYGGVPQWSYNVAPSNATSVTASDGTTTNMPSTSTIDADLQGYLSQLGYGYQVDSPQLSTETITSSSPGQADVTVNEETVDYNVTVNGELTDQSVQITVDQNNNLIAASGPAFSVLPAVNYPLQSPAAGVAVLEAAQQVESAPVASDGTGMTTTTVPSDSNTTTTSTPLTPPIINVTLDNVSTSLASYTLTDGTVWMLPLYTYSGTVNTADGTSYSNTWSTIAVDPAYVQAPIASPGRVNPGGPIMY
jgi:hypothetical protein